LPVEVFSLPSLGKNQGRTEWRLDERGLEWTDLNGKDKWMPFACVRLVTLGQSEKGWRLRLSGPPGAVTFGTGLAPLPKDLGTFAHLAARMIEGATEVGCSVHFRFNNQTFGPAWLWARCGRKQESGKFLLRKLPN
jgi:hypothetical protein